MTYILSSLIPSISSPPTTSSASFPSSKNSWIPEPSNSFFLPLLQCPLDWPITAYSTSVLPSVSLHHKSQFPSSGENLGVSLDSSLSRPHPTTANPINASFEIHPNLATSTSHHYHHGQANILSSWRGLTL